MLYGSISAAKKTKTPCYNLIKKRLILLQLLQLLKNLKLIK
nr:MAG TPA: hypothetical protein [Caudoviricetes sp.]